MKLPSLLFKCSPVAAIITAFLISFVPEAVSNPFLSQQGERKPAAAPVISGSTGPFMELQFSYRDKVASILREIKAGSGSVILVLAGASFLYGLFHAAGPGHRKTVVFSIFLSRKTAWYEPLAAGFLSAAVHAGTSLAVILVLWIVQRSVVTLANADLAYRYMEGATFILLFLFAVFLILLKVYSIYRNSGADASQQNRGIYPLVVVTSIVPCPGAMMVLILSMYLEIIYAGVAGVISMSAGMGIVISASGYLAFAGREGLFSSIKKRGALLKKISAALEFLSYIIIALFAAYMASPFIFSFAR